MTGRYTSLYTNADIYCLRKKLFFVVQKVSGHKLLQNASIQLRRCGIDRPRRAAFIALVICPNSSHHIGACLTPAAGADFLEITQNKRSSDIEGKRIGFKQKEDVFEKVSDGKNFYFIFSNL